MHSLLVLTHPFTIRLAYIVREACAAYAGNRHEYCILQAHLRQDEGKEKEKEKDCGERENKWSVGVNLGISID